MFVSCLFAAHLALVHATPAPASTVVGKYVEARTCDVFTGPCFANADTGITGKHAVLAWRIDQGTFAGQDLAGLSVVAVVAASDTLGQRQSAEGKAVLLLDERATCAQRNALVKFAQKQGGDLIKNVVSRRTAPIDLTICKCEGDACAVLAATGVRIETRCLDLDHDRGCGNEYAFYPPLAAGVTARPAMAIENTFSGQGFNETWSDADRRGAYVGRFAVQ